MLSFANLCPEPHYRVCLLSVKKSFLKNTLFVQCIFSCTGPRSVEEKMSLYDYIFALQLMGIYMCWYSSFCKTGDRHILKLHLFFFDACCFSVLLQNLTRPKPLSYIIAHRNPHKSAVLKACSA